MPTKCTLFITGTDTDVGKSAISAALASGLSDLGLKVAYWKPVQTGSDSDATFITKVVGEHVHIHPTHAHFALAASPDQAAAAEQALGPSVAALTKQLAELQSADDEILLIEGAGGLLVPLNDSNETWADLLAATKLQTILVSRTKLGTLNHTSLTIEVAKQRALPILTCILNGEIHLANLATLERLYPELPFNLFETIVGLSQNPRWRVEATRLAKDVLQAIEGQTSKSEQLNILARDQRHVWHPYTQHKNSGDPLVIKGASGVWLELDDGRKVIDGNSSWWVNNIGHGRPEIAEAIATQQRTLDHCIFAGATHEPGVKLAERITTLAGNGLNKAFYSDNGSTAVEVALKMVLQRWARLGQPERRRFVAFRGSYHGDTFGAMAVGAESGFHDPFKKHLFECSWSTAVTHHRSTYCEDGIAGLRPHLEQLDRLILEQRDQLAGIIVEPLIQGAAGMLMQPVAWLQHVASLAKSYDLPLIVDEVFTGFGRVGAMFAFQRADVRPDIICLAKGLTGGTMPLAMTLTTDAIYEAFLDESKSNAFLHGHSYTGNPIACAAALAATDILQREQLVQRALEMESAYLAWLDQSKDLGVENGRALGGVLAFELPGSGTGNYFNSRAAEVSKLALAHQLFLRPLGNTVYFMPPLSITDSDRTFALQQLHTVISEMSFGEPSSPGRSVSAEPAREKWGSP